MTDSTDKVRRKMIADFLEKQLFCGDFTLGDGLEVKRPDDNNIQLRVQTKRGIKYYLVKVTAPQ